MDFISNYNTHLNPEMVGTLERMLDSKDIMQLVDPREIDGNVGEYALWNILQSVFNANHCNDYIGNAIERGEPVDYDGASPHLLKVKGRRVVFSGWGVTAYYFTEDVFNYYNDLLK